MLFNNVTDLLDTLNSYKDSATRDEKINHAIDLGYFLKKLKKHGKIIPLYEVKCVVTKYNPWPSTRYDDSCEDLDNNEEIISYLDSDLDLEKISDFLILVKMAECSKFEDISELEYLYLIPTL